MCSITDGTLEHSPACARVHVTALKTHGVAGEATAPRVTWALRADETCARSHWQEPDLHLLPFFTLLNARACNTIKH
jgi:hypothetical protein